MLHYEASIVTLSTSSGTVLDWFFYRFNYIPRHVVSHLENFIIFGYFAVICGDFYSSVSRSDSVLSVSTLWLLSKDVTELSITY